MHQVRQPTRVRLSLLLRSRNLCHTKTFLPVSSVMWKVCSGFSSLTDALVGNMLPGWISLLAMAAMWCETEERMEVMVGMG